MSTILEKLEEIKKNLRPKALKEARVDYEGKDLIPLMLKVSQAKGSAVEGPAKELVNFLADKLPEEDVKMIFKESETVLEEAKKKKDPEKWAQEAQEKKGFKHKGLHKMLNVPSEEDIEDHFSVKDLLDKYKKEAPGSKYRRRLGFAANIASSVSEYWEKIKKGISDIVAAEKK